MFRQQRVLVLRPVHESDPGFGVYKNMKAKDIKPDNYYTYTKGGQTTKVRVAGPACDHTGKAAWFVWTDTGYEGFIALSRELSLLKEELTQAEKMDRVVAFIDGGL